MSICAIQDLQGYYRLHAHLYDATRWSFLFGRQDVLRQAVAAMGRDAMRDVRILEVGCGTGRNLVSLAKLFPRARITGLDLCAPMLRRAVVKAVRSRTARIRLVQAPYGLEAMPQESCDLVLFSYALSMFNPGLEQALDTARQHLRPGGRVAVVDFRRTGVGLFQRWMALNHVRMDDHILPVLRERFAPEREEIRLAYAGLWEYCLFLGRKV
ncbi:methylase involved in ubiquinone/menaquinone biosynthesis [Desulfocurvibacter africanus PCS]|uniref:Methylase involved in ubiquinone/menaquinone biosynthesis n=1 Tax=Desulfocurvibacter africanus PCS TaxID=1262666 RepID=M5PV96_DESAF|nr:class I SAM-dependent methyltransferase [Desulfocurvibacter africanus]EMG37915.1 methylase involved in ubiquinone/menaquinone biosynthesis [Desulfocurvibacter africanus PCS]